MDKKKINLLNDNPISLRDIIKGVIIGILTNEISTMLHAVVATTIKIIKVFISH